MENPEDSQREEEFLERAAFVAAVNAGLKDAEEGRVHDAREALQRLQVRLGIPR